MDDFQLRTLEEDCLRILNEGGARMITEETGVHYLLRCGLHSTVFYEVARALEKASHRERMARLILAKMLGAVINPKEIDVLLGPAVGALPLLFTMQHFYDLMHTRAIYAECNQEGVFELGRGFSLRSDERVFIIDDVGSTLGTIRKTIDAANRSCAKTGWDASIIGFAVLLDRRSIDDPPPEVFAPTLKYVYGIHIPKDGFPEELCPSCKKGIKLIKV